MAGSKGLHAKGLISRMVLSRDSGSSKRCDQVSSPLEHYLHGFKENLGILTMERVIHFIYLRDCHLVPASEDQSNRYIILNLNPQKNEPINSKLIIPGIFLCEGKLSNMGLFMRH